MAASSLTSGGGILFTAQIIREGHSYAYTKYPLERMEEFRELEGQAREARAGLWEE